MVCPEKCESDVEDPVMQFEREGLAEQSMVFLTKCERDVEDPVVQFER